MGRPIRGADIGSGSGNIQVTSYRFASASEATSPTGYIVNQRSTNKFKVSDGSTTEVLTLVNVAAGALAVSTFRITCKDSSGATKNVTKLRNRTVQHSATTNIKYTISDASPAPAGTVTVDTQ